MEIIQVDPLKMEEVVELVECLLDQPLWQTIQLTQSLLVLVVQDHRVMLTEPLREVIQQDLVKLQLVVEEEYIMEV